MRALAHVARWRPARLPATDGARPTSATCCRRPAPLSEHESALVLERYGVPFAPRRRAASPEEAAAAAAELGFPVVVKVDGVAHKAREGGVVVGVRTPRGGGRGGAAVSAARCSSPGRSSAGVEALCGMTRDPDYGPVLVVGAGGVAVEELARVVTTVAPIDHETAAELVAEAGIDDPRGVVALTLAALGRLALAHPEIESIDVNPLIVGAGGTVAVDALVVVA